MITIYSGGLVTKDPQSKRVLTVNWSDDFATGVTITPSVTITGPDSALTFDNLSVVDGRKAQMRLLGGTLNKKYTVTTHVITNESPAQEDDASFTVLIANK